MKYLRTTNLFNFGRYGIKNTSFIILIIFFLYPQIHFAQEKKPKVVLVLSGGGAKGVAHIPLLQKLDSLHIVPDLIVGNSMGSVMGGLYAMGHSGDSIAKFIKVVDWDKLLGGTTSLRDISIEEKSEFRRYMVELDMKKGKPLVNSYILNDQNLREYITTLTYPAYNINNFDNLSIPFRAMSTDLVHGKEIILSKGNLATAIRASMSLPGVFKPIPYENTLLVDGGSLDNFPTDIAQMMGADIIIGSDVGGGMEPKDKLNNIPVILTQLSMLSSNLKNDANRERCTILIDHLPNLKYSTGDFADSNQIYEEGKIATNQNLNALIALADKLKGYKQREHQLPKVENSFLIDTIVYDGVSKENLELVVARSKIKLHEKYSTQELIKGINRMMGTELFNEITYEHFVYDTNKTGIIIHGFEHSKNQIKGSLHFDSDRGFGVIVNYTGRNILGDASRFITTIDFAQQPRFRVEYQKIFGEEKNWWWDTEAYGEHLIQEIFVDGKNVDDVIEKAFQFNNQINRNFNSLSSYIGFGLNYQYTQLTPKTDPEFNAFSLNEYHFNNIDIDFHYAFNDMDEVFFATKGNNFYTKISRSFLHEVTASFYLAELPNESGSTNGFTKFSAKYEKRVPIKKYLTGIFGANTSYIFEDKLQSNELSFNDYGYAEKYFIGGILPIPDKNSYNFPGLNQQELAVTQYTELFLAAQLTVTDNVFFIPHFNVASVGYADFDEYVDEAFDFNSDWQNKTQTSLLMSAGALLSYNSFLGPINIDGSWINGVEEFKFFLSLGLSFNISN